MDRRVAGMAAIGGHSPAKNIIGKNRIAPIAFAARPVGATAAMNTPMANSAAAARTTASTNPASCLGRATPKQIRTTATIRTSEAAATARRSEEHTSELQSLRHLV